MVSLNERSEEILAAACRVVVRRGTIGLRMSDVAAEAGVSSALVHYYFRTRRDLVASAFEHADRRIDERLAGEAARLGSAAERLEYLLSVHGEDDPLILEEWAMWAEARRQAMFDRDVRARVVAAHGRWLARIASVLADGTRDGSLALGDAPAAIAARLTALVDGLGVRFVLGDMSTDEMRALIRHAITLELRPEPAS